MLPTASASFTAVEIGMRFTKLHDEVYVTDTDITKVSARDIDFLKKAAAGNSRRRARLCAHRDNADLLHEMLIVLAGDIYVRPHKHRGKSESFHIVEGRLKVFVFDDDGGLVETIQMGEPGSGETFFYRLSREIYHSVHPETEYVVFHEVTDGPFDRKDAVFAPWAPAEDGDPEEQKRFVQGLLKR